MTYNEDNPMECSECAGYNCSNLICEDCLKEKLKEQAKEILKEVKDKLIKRFYQNRESFVKEYDKIEEKFLK